MHTKTDWEEVRRRFVRQNRDLVKSNSAQSIRIRTLELDVARLLSENLALREKVLHLQTSTHKVQVKETDNVVDRIKSSLQQKLSALGHLVDELETLKHVGSCTSDAADGMTAPSLQWKERVSLMDALREQQMPTIVENKSHFPQQGHSHVTQNRRSPRRSKSGSPETVVSPRMRPSSGVNLEQSATLSPCMRRAAKSSQVFQQDHASSPVSVNLETRRKRKDMDPARDTTKRPEIACHDSLIADFQQPRLKAGAKRKLADRENDRPTEDSLQRKITADRNCTLETAETKGLARPDRASMEEKVVQSKPVLQQRVLSDKSVNISPKKAFVVDGKDAKPAIAEKRPATRPTTLGRRVQRPSLLPVPSPTRSVAEGLSSSQSPQTNTSQRPITPQTFELLSPTLMHGSQDTPPPSNFGSSLSALHEGRQSRRVRSAVNYAEPSLVAKMRRPGKQLVDAVTGLQDPRRLTVTSMETKTDETTRDEGPGNNKGVDSTSASTNARGSPMGMKSMRMMTTSESGSSLVDSLPNGTQSLKCTSSQDLVTEVIPNESAVESAAKRLAELDLFDFRDVSPVVQRPARTSRSQRRHTTVLRDIDTSTASNTDTADADSSVGRPRMDRVTSRRRSMMI